MMLLLKQFYKKNTNKNFKYIVFLKIKNDFFEKYSIFTNIRIKFLFFSKFINFF